MCGTLLEYCTVITRMTCLIKQIHSNTLCSKYSLVYVYTQPYQTGGMVRVHWCLGRKNTIREHASRSAPTPLSPFLLADLEKCV